MRGINEIKAVTFDAGGTLINAWPSVGAVYAEVLADHNILVEPETINERFGIAFAHAQGIVKDRINDEADRRYWYAIVSEAIGCFCPEDKFDSVFDKLYRTFATAKRWKLLPGALETMSALHAKGYRLAILSNADSRFRQVFREMGIQQHVEKVFISSEIGFEKPDPRIFRHVESTMGLAPSEFLHIGDSPFHDGDGAIYAGWHYRIVGEDTGDYHTVDHLSDIPGLLQSAPATERIQQP